MRRWITSTKTVEVEKGIEKREDGENENENKEANDVENGNKKRKKKEGIEKNKGENEVGKGDERIENNLGNDLTVKEENDDGSTIGFQLRLF